MLALEHHPAVSVEDLPHIGFVVLAGNRDEDALVSPAQQQFLEIAIGRARKLIADLSPVDAVLADDAAPQGIVGVNHHAFFSSTARSHDDAAKLPPERIEK